MAVCLEGPLRCVAARPHTSPVAAVPAGSRRDLPVRPLAGAPEVWREQVVAFREAVRATCRATTRLTRRFMIVMSLTYEAPQPATRAFPAPLAPLP